MGCESSDKILISQEIGLVNLKTPKGGGPFAVKVTSKDELIIINDVLIGEVWLASGQSNMEMPLKGWPPNDPIDNSEI